VVISGQCLEHVEEPWNLVTEFHRVCRPGGLCFCIAPWNLPEHRFPVDCYRYLPDGMRHLFTKVAKFDEIRCGHGGNLSEDCWFLGKKPVKFKN
jgi:SAM-dependent methyltransferase